MTNATFSRKAKESFEAHRESVKEICERHGLKTSTTKDESNVTIGVCAKDPVSGIASYADTWAQLQDRLWSCGIR